MKLDYLGSKLSMWCPIDFISLRIWSDDYSYLDSLDIIPVEAEVALVPSVERSHQGRTNVGVGETKRVSKLVSSHLEQVGTWEKKRYEIVEQFSNHLIAYF